MPLFDTGERKPKWAGSTALVPIEPGTCPIDGATLVERQMHQAALFRHGGYGATTATTIGECPECGWTLKRQSHEVKP